MSTTRHIAAAGETAQPALRPAARNPDAALIDPEAAAGAAQDRGLVAAVEIRPIEAGDAARITAAFAYTSAETYRRRFHAAKRSFSREELDYLTNVDGRSHVALVAIERGQPRRLAAEARFAIDPAHPCHAELGICVYDPFRRRGLGAEMLRRLCQEASARGVTHLQAMVQFDNPPMRALMYRVRPDTQVMGSCDGEIDYLIPVSDDPSQSAEAPNRGLECRGRHDIDLRGSVAARAEPSAATRQTTPRRRRRRTRVTAAASKTRASKRRPPGQRSPGRPAAG